MTHGAGTHPRAELDFAAFEFRFPLAHPVPTKAPGNEGTQGAHQPQVPSHWPVPPRPHAFAGRRCRRTLPRSSSRYRATAAAKACSPLDVIS